MLKMKQMKQIRQKATIRKQMLKHRYREAKQIKGTKKCPPPVQERTTNPNQKRKTRRTSLPLEVNVIVTTSEKDLPEGAIHSAGPPPAVSARQEDPSRKN
jgi:hypothetical protein